MTSCPDGSKRACPSFSGRSRTPHCHEDSMAGSWEEPPILAPVCSSVSFRQAPAGSSAPAAVSGRDRSFAEPGRNSDTPCECPTHSTPVLSLITLYTAPVPVPVSALVGYFTVLPFGSLRTSPNFVPIHMLPS